jgi:protein-S-isoprenylcysteine O-methyltransferase Ste14
MELIKLFLLGASGYLLAGLYDIALLYRKELISKIFYLGFFITAIPFVFLFLTYSSAHTMFISLLLALLMFCFFSLLIYSVLLEIPLKKEQDCMLYKKGTYSLCRHPGFLWHTAFCVLTSLYFWYTAITLMMIGFILCNFILIVIEDVFLFPKMFDEYEEYKKTTPFLAPF